MAFHPTFCHTITSFICLTYSGFTSQEQGFSWPKSFEIHARVQLHMQNINSLSAISDKSLPSQGFNVSGNGKLTLWLEMFSVTPRGIPLPHAFQLWATSMPLMTPN